MNNDSIDVDSFVDDIVSIVTGIVIADVCSSKKISFHLGGWNLHDMELRGRYAERKYIEHYNGKSTNHFKIKIPEAKMLRKPKKPR